MFPTSILQGTYNQSSSSGSGSFLSLPAPLSYMTKLGSNLYATTAAASGAGLYVSTDDGANWNVAGGTNAGSSYSVSNTARILPASTKIIYLNNGVINTYTESVTNFVTVINTGISGLGTIRYIKQIDNYYYISDSSQTYRTNNASLNTGWTSLGTGTASYDIEKGNGCILLDQGGGIKRTTDDFSTTSQVFTIISGEPTLVNGSNDGTSNNFFRILRNASVSANVSTDAGATFSSADARPDNDGTAVQQSGTVMGNAYYLGSKWYWMPSNHKQLVSTTSVSGTNLTVATEHDFDNNPTVLSLLYMSFVNSGATTGTFYIVCVMTDNSYKLFKYTVT